MRTEFNNLVETMQRYDLYNSTDEVGIALKSLFDKIIEVENRLTCVINTNKDIRDTIFNNQSIIERVISYDDLEVIQRSIYDIDIACDLNDTEPIENNWYKLFEEPKKEEPKILIPKGSILQWKEKINYYSANGGAKVRVIEDYIENKGYINVEWIDKLSNGQENGNYDISNFKEEFELPTIPSYQCRNQDTFDKVKEVIQILKTLDNGQCVDGETMDYIIKELGFEEYLLRSLIMNSPETDTKDLLEEKRTINEEQLKL